MQCMQLYVQVIKIAHLYLLERNLHPTASLIKRYHYVLVFKCNVILYKSFSTVINDTPVFKQVSGLSQSLLSTSVPSSSVSAYMHYKRRWMLNLPPMYSY